MNDKVFTFTQDAGPEEWSALPKLFKTGDQVKRFHGHTYGLDRDDAMYFNRETIPCYLPEHDGSTFFTIPVEFLVGQDGKSPCGDYMTKEKMKKVQAVLRKDRY